METIIRFMEEKQIILGTGAGGPTSVTLADREALNVLPYRYIVPFVRIKTVSGYDTDGWYFTFRHAALLSYPEEANRFVNLTVTGLGAAGGGGGISTVGAYAGSVITDPGALLAWKISQSATTPSTVSNFIADIYLVCRTG